MKAFGRLLRPFFSIARPSGSIWNPVAKVPTCFWLRLTGCPVLVNTSFNVRGEPIVCTPEDAYRCFLATDMDVLVLEDVVVTKDAASRKAGAMARDQYLAQFQLD